MLMVLFEVKHHTSLVKLKIPSGDVVLVSAGGSDALSSACLSQENTKLKRSLRQVNAVSSPAGKTLHSVVGFHNRAVTKTPTLCLYGEEKRTK